MENQAPVKPSTGRTILRWIKNIILTVVALICAGIAYAGVQSWIYERARSQVRVEIDSLGRGCEPQFPLGVWVINGSSKVVELTHFEFTARRPGFSRDLVSYGNRHRSWDKIIRPGESYGACYAYPALDAPEAVNDHSFAFRKSLDWDARGTYVGFAK